MNKKFLNYAQIGLIVLLILLNGYLAYEDYTGLGVCLPGSENQCSTVQNSVYGTLFGIKLGYLGFFAFLLLFAIYIIAKLEHVYKKIFHKLFLVSSILGGLFAGYFLFIQFFILKQMCTNCVIIDSLMIIVLVLSIFDFVEEIKTNSPHISQE